MSHEAKDMFRWYHHLNGRGAFVKTLQIAMIDAKTGALIWHDVPTVEEPNLPDSSVVMD